MVSIAGAALAVAGVAEAQPQIRSGTAKALCGKGQIAVIVNAGTGTIRSSGRGHHVCKRLGKLPKTAIAQLGFEDRVLDGVALGPKFRALEQSQPVRRLLGVIRSWVDSTIASALTSHHTTADRAGRPAFAQGGSRPIDIQHGSITGPDGKPLDTTTTLVGPADGETGFGGGGRSEGVFDGAHVKVDAYTDVFVKQCPDANGIVPGDLKGRYAITASAELHGKHLTKQVTVSYEGKLEGHVLENGRIKDFDYHSTASLEVKGEITNGAEKLLARAPTQVFRVRFDVAHIDPHNPFVDSDAKNIYFNGRGPRGNRTEYADTLLNLGKIVHTAVLVFVPERYLDAEKHWYDNAACLTVDWSPPSGQKLSGGQSLQVDGRVKSTVDQSEVPIHLKASADYGASVSPTEADTAPPSPAQFTFTAPPKLQDLQPDFRVEGVSKRGRVEGRWDAVLEPPCCTYKILNASFSTHASGSQTGDVCSLGGLTSTGTRDFTGVMTTQPTPPVSKLELDQFGNVRGQILATTSAKWTNDAIHTCKFDANGNLVPCDFVAPDHSPTSGTWPVEYAIDFQPKSATLSGHWAVLGGSIGWVAGPPVGTDCAIFGIGFDLDYADTAQTQPLATFTDLGPHTISFSGSKHFESSALGLTQTLDYSWSYSITFIRVDENGNPL